MGMALLLLLPLFTQNLLWNCARWSLIVPAGDSDVKSMLKDSGVILLADWASSGKKKVNDRRERACALLWARSMLHEPEAYLHLSRH